MMTRALTERYREHLAGVLSCYDLKRIGGTYRYYLTRIGRAAIAAGCHITQNILIPALA
jgi:hypothetical protein